jgi:hypothetical protein
MMTINCCHDFYQQGVHSFVEIIAQFDKYHRLYFPNYVALVPKHMPMVKYYIFSLLLLPVFVIGQTQERDFPQKAYEIYPTLADMYGYAFGMFNGRILVVGGKIKADSSEEFNNSYPNTDIIMVDLPKERAVALSSGSLEGTLAEQMSAYGYSFHQRGNELYVIGGYGYSESQNSFITFPYITAIDLTEATDAIGNAASPVDYFHQYCEEDLAIFDGVLDYNGETYFIINGKRAYKRDPFEDQPRYSEESLQEQVRTFQISGQGDQLKVNEIQIWYDMQALEDYYGPLLPEKIVQELQQIIQERDAQ